MHATTMATRRRTSLGGGGTISCAIWPATSRRRNMRSSPGRGIDRPAASGVEISQGAGGDDEGPQDVETGGGQQEHVEDQREKGGSPPPRAGLEQAESRRRAEDVDDD